MVNLKKHHSELEKLKQPKVFWLLRKINNNDNNNNNINFQKLQKK